MTKSKRTEKRAPKAPKTGAGAVKNDAKQAEQEATTSLASIACLACSGRGKVEEESCPDCNGTGVRGDNNNLPTPTVEQEKVEPVKEEPTVEDEPVKEEEEETVGATEEPKPPPTAAQVVREEEGTEPAVEPEPVVERRERKPASKEALKAAQVALDTARKEATLASVSSGPTSRRRKNGSKKKGLRKGQVDTLRVLSTVTRGMDRQEIGRLGNIPVCDLSGLIGSNDPDSREYDDKYHYPCLLTLGMVTMQMHDVGGKDKILYYITEKGRSALKEAGG